MSLFTLLIMKKVLVATDSMDPYLNLILMTIQNAFQYYAMLHFKFVENSSGSLI